MKTILVPTDFSDNADNALQYAAALASQVKGHIILVHAIALQVFGDAWGKMVMQPDPRLEPYYYQKLNQLSGQIRLEHGFKFTVEQVCVHGALIPHLKSLVQRKKVDIVVMGTQGASTFRQKFLGTQTAGFIRESVCPVLAIPAQAQYNSLKTLVYAADFEHAERSTLAQLQQFTQTFNLDLTILNIRSEEQLDITPDHQVLAEINAALPNTPYEVVQLEKKEVVAGIWEYVGAQNPSVLAIAIRQRDFLETILHDSVSEKLLFQKRLPLLALPEHLLGAPETKANPTAVAAGV